MTVRILLHAVVALSLLAAATAHAQSEFAWPEGKQFALSLSFDDARPSQVDAGIPLFERFGAKVTFYVVPGTVEQRLDGWKRLAAAGHEIGNHSLHHPCSGNFTWARNRALENYTLPQMREELRESNRRIDHLLGVEPETFAYPCGQTFVGRGEQTQSYVPVVAELFIAGRGWLAEAPNDPVFVDLAQVFGMSMDAADFDDILPLLERARQNNLWLVLAGHEIGGSGRQTTRIEMLERLIAYAQEPANQVWIAPVSTVARFILEQR